MCFYTNADGIVKGLYKSANELKELIRIQQLSFQEYSRMTVVTGRRRRIGKTSLIWKSVENTPTVYLFISRKNESSLCVEFSEEIRKSLNVFVPDGIRTFRSLFQYLLELATNSSFNLVIDEFQEFYNINDSVYSDMQNLWDQYRKKTHIHLILSGSVYSLMNKKFQNTKEPLYGRADNIIKLYPFDTTTLKEIMSDYHPAYTPDDLLALYTFTGGIPKYLELFCDNTKLKVDEMIRFMVRDNSPFSDEGKNLLVEEFGKNYATYSGKILEKYFKQRMAESMEFRAIGSWWEPKNNQNEIDIVALKLNSKDAFAIEVKRNKKKFKPELLTVKVEHLKNKVLPNYSIETMCWSLEDM